jgi:hypothetical protein
MEKKKEEENLIKLLLEVITFGLALGSGKNRV